MRFGVTLPNLGLGSGPGRLVDLAVSAERAGWDGVFLWDTFGSGYYDDLIGDDPERRAPWDAWSVLAAIAVRTERIRIGTMISAPARRRPWNLAAQAATVDQLSGGRLILSVGLGWVPDAAFSRVGEKLSRLERAERLDESLDIAAEVWSARRASFTGRHYTVDSIPSVPSAQQPRVPIWVVGAWPRQRSVGRALRFDGMLPAVEREHGGASVWAQPDADEIRSVVEDVAPNAANGFDIVAEGYSSRDPMTAAEKIQPFADAGATWWLEGVWGLLDRDAPAARILDRIEAGPPPIEPN